jgi:hypothetical protein
VTPGIEGLLEIAHVCILLGVNARIREQHRKITKMVSKSAQSSKSSERKVKRPYSMKNFIVAEFPDAVGEERTKAACGEARCVFSPLGQQ